jgi:uncharacterized membrane protein
MTEAAHEVNESVTTQHTGETKMNKMMAVVFNTEADAYKGLSVLKKLHEDGDITLYATAVLVKNAAGEVIIKQSADEGPIGTGLGMLVGSMVGLLAGPVGLAVGASVGGMAGMIADLDKSDIDVQFADDVSRAISPGKAAVLGDVEESWTVPVDEQVGKLGGMVFRRLRSEIVEDQLVRESAEFNAEIKQLKGELAQAHANHKAAIQAQIDEVKHKAQMIQNETRTRIEQVEREAEAKITALREQLKNANDRQKAKIENRIAETKVDLEARLAKLRKAGQLAREALIP